MRSLLWKEWHEQWWKLAYGCLVLAAITFIGLRARLVPDVELAHAICIISAVLLPVLACPGLVPAERDARTFESLIALPIQPRHILRAKSWMGVLLCVGPLACGYVVAMFVAGGREIPAFNWLVLFGGGMLASLTLLFWMIALTIRLPSETRAGLMCLAVVFIWGVLSLAIPLEDVRDVTWYALTPAVFLMDSPEYREAFGLAIPLHGTLALLVWFIAAGQFTHLEGQA